MHPLRVIWIGRGDEPFVRDGVAHYLERIRHFQPIETVAIRPASHSARDPGQGLRKEAEALLGRLDPEHAVVLLDERGKSLSSQELARLVGQVAREQGRPLVFVVGGAYGVDESVRRRAQWAVSLSRLTLPHQLARLVLVEQVYRALTLLAGHGYHHE
jgi:23S rRNA (pseudouridine1915-N3)-methyltransferase